MFVHYASLLVMVICAAPAPLSGSRTRITRTVRYGTLRHYRCKRERSYNHARSVVSFWRTPGLSEDNVVVFPLAQDIRGPGTFFILLVTTASLGHVFFLGRSIVSLLVVLDLHKVSSVITCGRAPAVGISGDVTFFNR